VKPDFKNPKKVPPLQIQLRVLKSRTITAEPHLTTCEIVYNFIFLLLPWWFYMDSSDNTSPLTVAHKNYITHLLIFCASVGILHPFLETVCA
jgi:hypothetical protein